MCVRILLVIPLGINICGKREKEVRLAEEEIRLFLSWPLTIQGAIHHCLCIHNLGDTSLSIEWMMKCTTQKSANKRNFPHHRLSRALPSVGVIYHHLFSATSSVKQSLRHFLLLPSGYMDYMTTPTQTLVSAEEETGKTVVDDMRLWDNYLYSLLMPPELVPPWLVLYPTAQNWSGMYKF